MRHDMTNPDGNHCLISTKDVIDALGGISAVADLTGRKYSAASNWPNFTKFPANTYLVLTRALAARGLRAPASLWGMIEASATPSERVAS
jgi:hypothetical protein